MRTYSLVAAPLLAVAIGTTHTPAIGQSMSLGDLICSVGPGTKSDSAAVVDSHNVICLFAPLENGPEETYTGTLLTAGGSDELADQKVVIWAVRGSEPGNVRAGMLEQTFAGSVADADGAKGPLVGDVNASVALQLMTKRDAAQPGKPATASIELKLKSATG